jgi:uncharacterized protein
LKSLKKLIYTLVAIYFIGIIVIYFFQNKFILHPTKLKVTDSLKITESFYETNTIWLQNKNLNTVFFPKQIDTCKAIVIYFHGNTRNVERYAPYTKIFTQLGYGIVMPDYPTFGKTTGPFKEENLYLLADTVYEKVKKQFPNKPIIIYGKSLGTGVAAYLASKQPCTQLILETPYNSMPSLFADWTFVFPTKYLLKLSIPTYKYLQKIQVPITIFHGTNDWVIPLRNAKRLVKVLKPQDQFIICEGADHVSINQDPVYIQKIKSIMPPL